MGSAGSLSAEPDVAEGSPAEPDVTEGSPAPKAIKEWVFPAPYPSVKAGYASRVRSGQILVKAIGFNGETVRLNAELNAGTFLEFLFLDQPLPEFPHPGRGTGFVRLASLHRSPLPDHSS